MKRQTAVRRSSLCSAPLFAALFSILLPAASCVVAPSIAIAQSPALLATIANPGPEAGDRFSWAVAALGNDRVLVGAPYDGTTNAGAVYLFRTNGTLLTTFTNPSPTFSIWFGNPELDGDLFGIAVAGVGNDRVLIGAPYDGSFWAGRAYLFRTNGTLVTYFDTPSMYGGGDRFGAAAAVLGNDRLIISAPGYTSDPDIGNQVGVVYLLNTNSNLLATLNNPDQQQYAEFGFSVAPFGTDRVLVGARDAGAAYLFDTNGALLTTFTNPAPATFNHFGHSVAAVGTERVFIGAPQADAGAEDAGVGYLFSTNGALLTTITNPSPALGDSFGARVAVLGSDRIVISSIYDDIGATNSGAAYVFSPNGTLLNTITNPTPAASDAFGARVAALGNDRVIIGATFDDLGATDTGTAYLFSVPLAPATPPPPSLTIRRTTTNTVVVSWPSAATGFALQQNTNGLSSVNWSNVTSGIVNDGTTKTLVINPASGARFYRLVPAQEDGTIKISSTFYMDGLYGTVGPDLAEVFANGHEHTWTLALHGTSQSHQTFTNPFGVTSYATEIHASSFDLEFSGPDAATLNGIVSEHLAGGDVQIYLENSYSSGFGDDFAIMYVWPSVPDMYFFSGHDLGVFTLFPADADGYPVVGPDPFSIESEYSELSDMRPGNNGVIVSRESLVTFEGSVGGPDPGEPVVLAVADASVLEGDGGTSNVAVAVTLSSASSQAITVSYRTIDGTALANSDHTATSGTLTFQPGETSRTISVSIKGDRKREANETFSVQLSNAVGATIDDGVATVTILNDD